ncbi:shikimate kinase [Rickettsiales bacterium]|nr:shikimate kinase [Rickettsiales bacterium]
MNNVAAKNKKIITLIGIMGVGKTTIGNRLAKKLSMDFIDSDKEIEKDLNTTINQIFTHKSEAYFRKIEAIKIKEIIEEDRPVILSIGGGAFNNANTRKLIQENTVSVWLNADIEVLLERVSRNNNRPLLNNVDKKEVLTKMIKERSVFYEECDIKIDSGAHSHNKTVENIISKIQEIL